MDLSAVLSKLSDLVSTYWSILYYPALKPLYFASALGLALISYLYYSHRANRLSPLNFIRFCFPKSVYLHKSTRTDLIYLLVYPMISSLLFAPALAFSTYVFSYENTQALLQQHWEPSNHQIQNVYLLISIFIVMSILVQDFGYYCQHYAFHKISFLWEFHKVHHSAEVLTPMTDYRVHPLELMTIPSISGLFVGFVQGIFGYFFAANLSAVTLGAGYASLFYYVVGYHLRHTHIWVSYGPVLNRFFISPAQHQIHHSAAVKHFDKNLGGLFAIWDLAFGTLYVPKRKEEIEYGLANEEHKAFSNAWRLYALPFRNNTRTRMGTLLVAIMLVTLLFFSVRHVVDHWRDWVFVTSIL